MKNNKTRRLWVRLTDGEYERLRQNAASQGCSMSEHIRRTAVYGERTSPVVIDMDPIRKALYNVQRIGGNFNQVVHAINTFGVTRFDEERIDDAIEDIHEMRGEIIKLIADLREGRLNL